MIRRIAIVEDDDDLRNLLKMSLQAAGYEVISYSNGYDLIDGKESNPNPDLYIIDLNLSGTSGLELCKLIKGHKKNGSIPIMIMSANPDLRQIAIEACADDTLQKPFSTKELLNKMSRCLSQIMVA